MILQERTDGGRARSATNASGHNCNDAGAALKQDQLLTGPCQLCTSDALHDGALLNIQGTVKPEGQLVAP
jgi:hypothetical protein